MTMKAGSNEPVSEKAIVAEETALAADISAAHAEKAIKQADTDQVKAERAAAKNTPDCPHCGRALEPHNDTEGLMHCRGAKCGPGCCFAPSSDGPQLRSGTPFCPALGR